MNELAMLYFFIMYMKTSLLQIAPSLHPRIYWNTHKYNKDNAIWRNDEISSTCIFPQFHSVLHTSKNMPKLPATVAVIMLLVKVRGDLSSAFVNLDSVGMDKIAQVMEFLRATMSPHIKSDSNKDLVFLSLR